MGLSYLFIHMHCKCDVRVWRSGRAEWTCRGGREWRCSRRVVIKVKLWKETSSMSLCPRSEWRLINPSTHQKVSQKCTPSGIHNPTNIDRTPSGQIYHLAQKFPLLFGIYLLFPTCIYFSCECHENWTKNVNERNDIGEKNVTECVQRLLIMTASLQL